MAQNNSYLLTDVTLHCPNCKLSIGRFVLANGRVHILHGAIVARAFYHFCPVDGRKFYFDGKNEDERLAQKEGTVL